MKHSHRLSFIILPIILALLFSILGSIPVYAEEITPPIDQTTEPLSENSPTEAVPIDPADILQPTQEATLESLAETVAVTPTTAPEATESPVEESLDTLPEMLDQVPENTAIILLNPEGEQESLASQAAADILTEGDPMWCPAAATPGDSTCTTSYGTFTELINELKADALRAIPKYTGAGVIWVADSYQRNDTSQININGDELSNISSSNLTIMGGWDDGNGNAGTPGISEIGASLSINSWIGNVTLQNLFISNNQDNQGFGLHIETDGETILENVHADDSSNGNSGIIIEKSAKVTLKNSSANNNEGNGMWVNSSGDIDITNSTFNQNDFNGAYLLADGKIGIDQSYFEQNGNSATNGNGLYAKSELQSVGIDNSIFSNNAYGAGAYLISEEVEMGVVVANSSFTANRIGLQTETNDGVTILSNINANLNTYKGAYLSGSGMSLIQIFGAEFTGNGEYGLYSSFDEAYMQAIFVTVDGDGVTNTGAKLIFNNSMAILLGGSNFISNRGTGLVIIADGEIYLPSNTYSNNGGNGAEVYSTYTAKGCYCPGDIEPTETSVFVGIANNVFSNNGKWGLYVKSGPEGGLFINDDQNSPPTTFTDNTLGDYKVDNDKLPLCSSCTCNGTKQLPGIGYKIVEVPFSGGEHIPQECGLYAGTIIKLPDGSYVKISCPFTGFSSLEGVTADELPGPLEGSAQLEFGMQLELLDSDGSPILNSDGSVTISFKIPENSITGRFDILYWDPSLNDGKGAWFQLPSHKDGTNFQVDEDGRMIFSGLHEQNGFMTFTVNFPGTFVLVSK